MSQKQRRQKQGEQWGARALAALVALVTLLAMLRAGSSYVYCPSMQRVTDASCCSGEPHADDEDACAVQLRSRDCCEHHVLGKLPSVGTTAGAPLLLASPLLAVLPAPTVEARGTAPRASACLHHEGRAGPVAAARHRAELMVSLT